MSTRRRLVRTACLLGLLLGLGPLGVAVGQWVKPNDPAYRRHPADPHQESLFLLRMEEAWKIEKGSPQVVIGVIDLAFDAAHPDLKNQLWTNPKEIPGNGKDDDGNGFVDDIHGWDFLDNDSTLDGPQAEHGNHVAGIIAAQTNNGIGIAGMAPGCRLMLAKVGLAGCLRDGAIQARAIRYCVDSGARLICMNHGLSEYYPGWHVPVGGELKEACDDAYRKGVLIVTCTTSNDGKFYPATFPPAYDGVMGTGAGDLLGKPSGMYGGSCFCEAIAPGGERVQGDSHSSKGVYSCYAGSRLYHYYAGGCMATPHVVGLLALVLSHYQGLDVEQARQIVRNTAKGEKSGFDVRWGHGLIQPLAALSLRPEQLAPRPALQAAAPTATVANDKSLSQNGSVAQPSWLFRDRLEACATRSGIGSKPVYVVGVRNEGALDARVRLSLVRQGRTLADREATALGLKTTEVRFPADALPPAGELTVRMEALGMARPRVYDDVLEVKLRVADEDLTLRQADGGRQSAAVRVHNAGSVDASRVAVVLHHHEPAVARRSGPPSQMIDAQVIAVPASGTAEAAFLLENPAVASDLWAEIEQLDVGAPHVPKDRGKARLVASSAATLSRGRQQSDLPEVAAHTTAIPGKLETDKLVRVLLPKEAETFFFELSKPGTSRIHAAILQGSAAAEIRLSLRAAESGRDLSGASLSRQQPAWETRLDKGRYLVKLQSQERIAYRLNIQGAADVWQETFRATDRGAGARADYVAWLSTSSPGKAAFEVFNCSEGSRFLFLAPRGSVQAVIQTGGVMGDSSGIPQGGAGVWRQHAFTAGTAPCGAWLYYPSDINASGDYALRGNFTIHWRRPDDGQVLKAFLESPTMLVRKLRIRGGETTPANRRQRYREAIRAGLKFMATLTEKRDDGPWMYERWMLDRQAPRIYWGNDGQMLCARTFYHAFQEDGDPEHQFIALGIARRVAGYQQLDRNRPRYGAIPYGLIGKERKISWGSSNNIQGKILYGLAQLAAASGDAKLLEALRLNADYYARVQYPDGRWAHFVEQMPKSVCGYATAWGTAGLLVAYEQLKDPKHLESAERALAAYRKGRTPEEGLRSDGSILCHCNHGNPLEDDHAIRSSITMLTPYSLAYRITKKPEYREVLDALHRYLAPRQHASGVIKQSEDDCVNLIYAQNWGPQGFCEAYEATGDEKFLQVGLRLADFFVRVQLLDENPHLHGAWVGSYNVAKDSPGGNVDDEGNLYDLYTSWCAGPVVYGLHRLIERVER